jgi:ribosomal protein S8E
MASLRQDLADLQNTVSTLGQNNINTVFSALRQLPLFGPNTLLGADANSGFTFVPVSSVVSTTTTSPGSTTTTPSSGTTTTAIAYGDSTVSRINEAAMSDVVINDLTTLRNYLASDISDKRLLVSRSTAEVWEGYNEQTGAWTNVKLLCINRNIELRNSTGSTAWIFQGGKARNRVCIEGFKFSGLATGGGYPVFWWNELPQINGLEVKRCEFTAPNGEFNAMGAVQYSVASGSGSIAKNIYIHHNYIHDVGRMGMEWLSQGYDTPRLFNFVMTYNTFNNMGMNNEYGMSSSFSGLIRQLYMGHNRSASNKKVTYELVNTQDVLAEDNSGTTAMSTGKGTVGWGISDDDKHTTRNILVRGGDFDVSERPIYIYGSSNVTVDGQNKLWKGHRGVQMNGGNNSFTNMNILIHSTMIEPSWEITEGAYFRITNSKISSAGAVAAGYYAAFEPMVWRGPRIVNGVQVGPGVTNTSADNVTTIVGLQANGQPYASPENGGDGRIVNQGNNNTITNNLKSTAP